MQISCLLNLAGETFLFDDFKKKICVIQYLHVLKVLILEHMLNTFNTCERFLQ